MKQLMDVPETAALLNLSESYVYQLARQKRIPCVKIGSAVRFRREDIDAWIEELASGAQGNVIAFSSGRR